MKPTIVAVIPARMASSRFPGKPIAEIAGLPMIEHVRRRTLLCSAINQVVVATCDREIFELVEKNGGKAVMTSDRHERCTDRVAEAVRNLQADIIVNVQGDEPLLMPDHLEALIAPLISDKLLPCSNLTSRIPAEMAPNPNLVKVVFDNQHRALYFSREPIPSTRKSGDLPIHYFRQLGIIAFRRSFLHQFLDLSPTPLEAIESCDMMRAVEHGIEVRLIEVDFDKFGVDTPEDLKLADFAMQTDPLLELYR